VLDWPSRVAQVTAEDVAAAARRVLAIERSVTGVLLPRSGGDPSGPPSLPVPEDVTQH
jgi:predicted Zn-dependent peptidase